MPNAVRTEHPHLVRIDGVWGGELVIDGLRVTVRHVATLHRRGGALPEIAAALGLIEAQAFYALSYFSDKRAELEAMTRGRRGTDCRPPSLRLRQPQYQSHGRSSRSYGQRAPTFRRRRSRQPGRLGSTEAGRPRNRHPRRSFTRAADAGRINGRRRIESGRVW